MIDERSSELNSWTKWKVIANEAYLNRNNIVHTHIKDNSEQEFCAKNIVLKTNNSHIPYQLQIGSQKLNAGVCAINNIDTIFCIDIRTRIERSEEKQFDRTSVVTLSKLPNRIRSVASYTITCWLLLCFTRFLSICCYSCVSLNWNKKNSKENDGPEEQRPHQQNPKYRKPEKCNLENTDTDNVM